MSALFLRSYNDELVSKVAEVFAGTRSCMDAEVDSIEVAKQLLQKFTKTRDFGREEDRLLTGMAYDIHDVLCDNPDEARGWYDDHRELGEVILPLIRDSGLLVEFAPISQRHGL